MMQPTGSNAQSEGLKCATATAATATKLLKMNHNAQEKKVYVGRTKSFIEKERRKEGRKERRKERKKETRKERKTESKKEKRK